MSRRPAVKADQNAANPHAQRIAPDELKELVSGHYGTKTLLLGKEMAEALLGYNTANRSVSHRKVERLVQQMKSGEFENTGEPIIVSAEGVLNDGQHRLMALSQTDAEVEMDVRFGIARGAFTKTNTGTSRTGGDVLAIRGVVGGAAVAQAVRLLVLYDRGLPDSVRDFVSNAEIDDGYGRWKGIEAVGRQVAGYAFPRGIRSTPLLGTAYLASRSPGKGRLAPWLETLATGLAAGKSDPAYVLRERLMRGVEQAVGTRESMLARFAIMIMSWNAFAADRGMAARELRWTATGKTAVPFPIVDGARL